MDNLEPITRNEMFLNGDDLEPITREEMILAGEDLEPITRHEWFLKKYRGGGGGGEYDLVNIPDLPADIASFNDGTDLPMASLKVAVTPYQDLHGYDAPWAGGAGKNKLPSISQTQTINGVTWTLQSDGSIKLSGTATANSVYDFGRSDNLMLKSGSYFANENGTNYTVTIFSVVGGLVDTIKNGGGAFSISEDTEIFERVTILNGTSIDETLYPMIESGTTATAYAPYSNICPIIGWEEAVVTVADDAESPTTSHEYTIDLDGTRYGGELDVLNGVDIDTLGSVDLGTLNWDVYDSTLNEFITRDLINNKSTISGALSSHYTITDKGFAGMENGTMRGTSNNLNMWVIRDTRFTDPSAFKQAMNGVQLVYELATPITVQLAPTAVKSLKGENNISANCGQITEVKYFKKA